MDSIDELDMFEAERRLALYNEYRDAARVFTYYIETELRAYLANEATVEPVGGPGGAYFKVTLIDVWIYEAERINRFVPEVVIWSVNDVHVQRLKDEDASLDVDVQRLKDEDASLDVDVQRLKDEDAS